MNNMSTATSSCGTLTLAIAPHPATPDGRVRYGVTKWVTETLGRDRVRALVTEVVGECRAAGMGWNDTVACAADVLAVEAGA
jgi:hypothetical protein